MPKGQHFKGGVRKVGSDKSIPLDDGSKLFIELDANGKFRKIKADGTSVLLRLTQLSNHEQELLNQRYMEKEKELNKWMAEQEIIWKESDAPLHKRLHDVR